MPRIVLTEEEYAELLRFSQERNMNPKEAILAFVRAGNRSSSNKDNNSGKPGPEPEPAKEEGKEEKSK